MDYYLGRRFSVDAQRAPARSVALPVALVGHCGGSARPEVLDRFGLLEEIRKAGFVTRADAIQTRARSHGPAAGADDQLYDLPIPLYSPQGFDRLFPGARDSLGPAHSGLAGEQAWLPGAVDEFFANGGEKLWLVRVRVDRGVAGFGLDRRQDLRDIDALTGIGAALAVPEVAVIAMPDLERLSLPNDLDDPDSPPLNRPDAVFVPCAGLDETAPEEVPAPALATPAPPQGWVLGRVATLLDALRPDVMYLHTFRADRPGADTAPGIDREALAALTAFRNSTRGHTLRRVQLVFPYLRSGAGVLHSAVGAIAGKQSAQAGKLGVWRSMAGQRLVVGGRPFPGLTRQQAEALREEPGLGIIGVSNGEVMLDDERLCVPALHPDDYSNTASQRSALAGYRSAEVSRFIGYLLRQLRDLGDILVFEADPRDARPRILLTEFLERLFRLGALRGEKPADAFRVRQADSTEGVMQFEIEIAPAFPVDHVRLAFGQRAGDWQVRESRV